jgi:hypothetical protein
MRWGIRAEGCNLTVDHWRIEGGAQALAQFGVNVIYRLQFGLDLGFFVEQAERFPEQFIASQAGAFFTSRDGQLGDAVKHEAFVYGD